MLCYASLFSRWFSTDNEYLVALLHKGLGPEIGIQHGGFSLPPARHKEVAAIIKDHGLGCAIHLPFYGVQPGAADPAVWGKGRDILLRALDIAAWYEPDHLIGHPEYEAAIDSRPASEPAAPDGADQPGPRWLEQSAKLWAEILNLSPARLYLENTCDESPRAILSLLELLPDQAAMCFDIGHWFAAAGGSRLGNLAQWIELLAGRLGHLHLHDNHGREDLHLGIGRGEIDFDAFLALLKTHELKPTLTLEAHSLESLDQSLAWLDRLPPSSPLVF